MSETMIKITNLVKEYKMFARKKDRLLELANIINVNVN